MDGDPDTVDDPAGAAIGNLLTKCSISADASGQYAEDFT
jgi:hypothetical protein